MSDEFDPHYTWLSIPPTDRPADHYRLLGLQRFEENSDVIANAADQRMSYVRTFQSGQRAAMTQAVLNELARARLCLLDPDRKRAYDLDLKARLPSESESGVASPPVELMPVNVPALSPVPPAPSSPPPGMPSAGDMRGALTTPVSTGPPRPVPARPWWHQPAVWILGGGMLVAIALTVIGIALLAPRDPPIPTDGEPVVGGEVPHPREGDPPADETPPPVAGIGARLPAPTGDGKLAIRFQGPQRLQIGNSVGLPDLNADYTIELWLRMPAEFRSRQFIASAERADPVNPRLPRVSGWALRARPRAKDYLLEFNIASRQAGPQTIVSSPLASDGQWHHVAITCDRQLVRVFVDGEMVRATRYRLTFINGEAPIHIGPAPIISETRQFIGDVRGFAVATTCRYRSSFRPSLDLPRDDHAAIWLDFDSSSGATIVNRGARGGLGSLGGAAWVRVDFPADVESPSFPALTEDLLARALAEPGRAFRRGDAALLPRGVLHIRGGKPALFQWVHEPAAEYVVEVDARRVASEGGLLIGLVVGGRQCTATVDGFGDTGDFVTGIAVVDGRRPNHPDYAGAHHGQLLPANKTVKIACRVSPGEVTIEADGQAVYQWSGQADSLSLNPIFAVPESRALFLAAWGANIEIHRYQVMAP